MIGQGMESPEERLRREQAARQPGNPTGTAGELDVDGRVILGGLVLVVIAVVVLVRIFSGGSSSANASTASSSHSASQPTATTEHYDNALTLQEAQNFFDNMMGDVPAHAEIASYQVDGQSLTINTHIYGVDAEAKQVGRAICGYGNLLLEKGGTAITRYRVLNQDGDELCSGSPFGEVY